MVPECLLSFCDVALVFLAASTSHHLWQEEYKRESQKGMWKGRDEEDSTDYVGDAALLGALYQQVLLPQNNLTD